MRNEKLLIILSIIGTGISSISVQIVTVREFLSQFHGNEIIISLVLFTWLLLTGIGSLFAKIVKLSSQVLYSILIVLIAAWPLFQIIMIRFLRDYFFIHGVSPGFYDVFIYITCTTAPYCFLVGFILPYSLKILNRDYNFFSSGDLYIVDNVGDIAGGIIFSFILVFYLKPFKTIAVTSSLLFVSGLLLILVLRKNNLLFISFIVVSLFLMTSMNSNFERSSLSGQYGDILYYGESPYGRIVITKEGAQHTFWESGTPIYSDSDIISSEEKVHYPLSQLDSVSDVLLISGGLGETLSEIRKYHPNHIDYIELDPYLTDIAQELGFIKKDQSLRIINMDARYYLQNSRKLYDAIIIDLPDPDTFQLNRFYTNEFFSLAKKSLKKNGIISFGLKYSPNYQSEISRKKLSTVFNTAARHFRNVRVIPGGEAYFLCSDSSISTDITHRLKIKSINTEYIEGFFPGNVTPERIRQLQGCLDIDEYINTDFGPRVINLVFKEYFFVHGTSPKIFLYLVSALTLFYILFMKREEYILFSTGMVSMGVEMLIIFAFQVIYGYVYLKIGAIITVFLLGLLPGAIIGNLYRGKDTLGLMISEVFFLCLLMLFFIWNRFIRIEPPQYFFLVYCFIFSFFCGFQFPVVSGLIGEKQSPVAGCLAADLTGAALGTFVTGTILIPLGGMQSALLCLIMIKISSSVILFFIGKGQN